MPYSKFFEYLEMATIREGIKNGLEVDTLLSSFEQYRELEQLHKEILSKVPNG